MVGRGAEPRSSRTVRGGKDKAARGPLRLRVLAWLKWCDVAGFRLVLGAMVSAIPV